MATIGAILDQLKQLAVQSEKDILSVDMNEVTMCVENIDKAADNGFLPDEINRIAEMVVHPVLEGGLSIRLLRAAICRTTVPSKTIYLLLGPFTTIPLPLRLSIIQWMILSFESLENENELHGVYGILFHFLGYDTLRPHLCHLLHLLTRSGDVLSYRVRRLLRLQEKCGQTEPWLDSLIDSFRLFNSDIFEKVQKEFFEHGTTVPHNLHKSKLVFPGVNSVWKDRVSAVWANLAATTTTADGAATYPSQQRILLFRDVDRVVSQISMPGEIGETANVIRSRIVSAALPSGRYLLSRAVQHGVYLVGNHDVERITFWLQSKLNSVFDGDLMVENKSRFKKQLQERSLMWNALADLADFLQEVPEPLEDAVIKEIRVWDGSETAVLRLISRLRPIPYEKLYMFVLRPLLTTSLAGSTLTKARILHALTEMLRNWSQVDWDAHHDGANGYPHYGFTFIASNVDYFRTIYELCCFIDRLSCLFLMGDDRDHALLLHSILSFLETASTLNSTYLLPFTIPPSKTLAHNALSSGSCFAVSRMCGVFVNCKLEFEGLKSQMQEVELSFKSGLEKIGDFNRLILDYSNALWRSRVFLPGVFQSTAFCGLALKFLRSLDRNELDRDEEEILNVSMITGKLKVDYLQFLEQKHCVGLHRFLFTFIGSLVKLQA